MNEIQRREEGWRERGGGGEGGTERGLEQCEWVGANPQTYLIGKGHDDVSKVTEALVDILCLPQSLADRARVGQTLGAGQVNHIQSA